MLEDNLGMRLRPASDSDIEALMTWFQTEAQLTIWAGPGITFPFDQASFKQGLKLGELSSHVLTDSHSRFLGFGQFYLRLGRCHLGRLAINPEYRGQGLSQFLVAKLLEKGREALNVQPASLFVLKHNEVAINSYLKLGFEFHPYPEPMPLDNCVYMVKSD